MVRGNIAVCLSCLILLVGLFVGCRSSGVVPSLSAEELFNRGKAKFENEDFLEAIDDFTAVTLQYPGSSLADDAQYYLGECRFHRSEFLLGAYEYQTLRRNMPSSPLVSEAQYKTGLCYYMLAPRSSLDQDYSRKAVDEFQNFLEYFPTHELAQDAERKIVELNNRLAKKDYDTAVLYMKLEYYKAATMYFDNVLEQYHDTEYAEPSYVGKVEALMARRKYNEAKVEIEKFLNKYPESHYRPRIQSFEREVDSHLRSGSTVRETPNLGLAGNR